MTKKTISFLACALFAFAGTAHASAIVTDGNVSLGVDDYFIKPVSLQRLVDRMVELLDARDEEV